MTELDSAVEREAERYLRPEINALAVLVLGLLALFTFDRSFADRGYLVPAFVGIAFPLIAAVLCHRSDAGVSRFSFIAYAAFLPLGAWCAFGSPFRIGDVFGATKEAPRILLDTVPPADTFGAVLVLPFVLAYVAGAFSGWLALTSARPFVPAIPLVGVLALSVLFGTEETEAVLAKSVLFVGVLMAWLAYRSVSDPDVRHAGRGAVPRAAGTLLVVGALVLGSAVVIGDVGNRLVLRGLLGSGYDVGDIDNPLSDIKRYTDPDAPGSLSKKRLLTVDGLDQRTRLRFTVLDDFDGEAWQAGNDNVDGTREDRYQEVSSRIGTNAKGRSLDVTVDIGPAWSSDWLPTAGYLTSIRFTGEDRLDDVRYNPVAGAATLVDGLDAQDDYRFTAVEPSSDLPPNSEPYANDGDLQPDGAFLDDFLEPFREPGVAPLDRALLVAEYLKATGQQVLPRKVFGGGDGFVPAVALAAARLGVPARVVVGARADTRVVRGNDVESWVELRIADGTWRILPTDALTIERVPERDRQTPEEFLEDRRPPEPQGGAESSDTSLDDTASDGGLPWRFILIALTLILAIGVLPALKVVRRRRRRSAAGPDSAVGAWRDLVDEARDLGWDAPTGTRPSQAASWGDVPESASSVGLALKVDDVVFGGDTPSAAELEEIWSASDTIRVAWRAEAPIGRRLWAWWNPASLIASLRRRRGTDSR